MALCPSPVRREAHRSIAIYTRMTQREESLKWRLYGLKPFERERVDRVDRVLKDLGERPRAVKDLSDCRRVRGKVIEGGEHHER